MKQLLYLLFAVTLFTACSSDDDNDIKVDSAINLIARKDASGKNVIPAVFYIFKNDNYNPSTFSRVDQFASKATLTNTSGNVIESIAFKTSTKDDGYIEYFCNPGDYYIVCCPSGFKTGTIVLINTWKAKKIIVIKNKGTAFEAVFKNLYDDGYKSWDE